MFTPPPQHNTLFVRIINNSASANALFIVSILIILNRFFLPRFNTHDIFAILSWDVFGYYLYLPATFIHHDPGLTNFTWVQQILDAYHPTIGFYQAYVGPLGEYVMKYPMGMAILYSPFFFTGHLIALLSGFPEDGFSLPYQLCIAMGGLCYTVTGLWFARKILLHYFSDISAAITLVIIAAGTNYFQLTAFDGAMPHNSLFMLFAIIIWLTIRWNITPRKGDAILIGLLCGCAVLVRPTSVVIVIVPILWGIWNIESIREKAGRIRKYWVQVIMATFLMILLTTFQFVYWKIVTGTWFYYSYEQGEKLEWIAPYLFKVLFSYKKGWLVYAPVMVFSILGLVPLAVRFRSVFISVLLFFAAHLILVSSWSTWWYGGSLGQRAMMESYALLMIPLAALVQWVMSLNKVIRWPVFVLWMALITLNLFQTWQYMHMIFDPSRMTKEFYWQVFGKTRMGEFDGCYLEPSHDIYSRDTLADTSRYNSILLASFDFERSDQADPHFLAKDTSRSGCYSLRMSPQLAFSPGINRPYRELSKKKFFCVRTSGWVYFTCQPEEVRCGLVITTLKDSAAYKYRLLELEKARLVPGIWNKVSMDYITPYIKDTTGIIQAYFWYRGDKVMYLDDLSVRLFELNE